MTFSKIDMIFAKSDLILHFWKLGESKEFGKGGKDKHTKYVFKGKGWGGLDENEFPAVGKQLPLPHSSHSERVLKSIKSLFSSAVLRQACRPKRMPGQILRRIVNINGNV